MCNAWEETTSLALAKHTNPTLYMKFHPSEPQQLETHLPRALSYTLSHTHTHSHTHTSVFCLALNSCFWFWFQLP
eukprot:m.173399 g.173399  ORF g.173399 m.173399 type:complete len:75 (+) comp14586_c2_seq2:137-361(+)